MAGFLAATMPFPVAPALLAAPFSPGPPFLHGILQGTIAWEALGGDTPEVRERLGEILFSASILRFPAPPHTRPRCWWRQPATATSPPPPPRRSIATGPGRSWSG